MIKNVVTSIGGIETYGILSISLFFAFFAGMLIWALGKKKADLDAMSRLPIDDGEQRDRQNITTPFSNDYE